MQSNNSKISIREEDKKKTIAAIKIATASEIAGKPETAKAKALIIIEPRLLASKLELLIQWHKYFL